MSLTSSCLGAKSNMNRYCVPQLPAVYHRFCHIFHYLTLKSVQVSNFVDSGQELVPLGVSGIIKLTGLYIARNRSDGITASV